MKVKNDFLEVLLTTMLKDIKPSANPNVIMTVGQYVESLLTDMNYYNTRFPRIPIMIEREMKKRLLMINEKRERKQRNLEKLHFFVKGTKIKALSSEVNSL